MKEINTKCYMSLSNELVKWMKNGYKIIDEKSGKEYILYNGIDVIKITCNIVRQL